MLLRRHHGAANGPAAPVAEPERETPADDTAPAGNASRDAWAEYATSQGIDPETVGELSREEIKTALDNTSTE